MNVRYYIRVLNVHKSLAPNPILSQLNPAKTFTPFYLRIHFKIILPSLSLFATASISDMEPTYSSKGKETGM
jgi:hypothetical protein